MGDFDLAYGTLDSDDLSRYNHKELLLFFFFQYAIAATLVTDDEFVGNRFYNLDKIQNYLNGKGSNEVKKIEKCKVLKKCAPIASQAFFLD